MPETAAIVTGHTRGLGEAIATELLSRHVRVLGIARHQHQELGAAHAGRLLQVQLDLADRDATLKWLASDALTRFLAGSEAALLVNNAGLLQPIGPLQTQDANAVAQAIAVNVAAPLALSAAFVGATAGTRDRRVLHISSGAGNNAYAGWSVYCASKAALDQHARAVALDRTPGLRIASIAPGVIDTDMQAEIRATSDDRFPDRHRFEALKRDGKLRLPDEAAGELVDALLASEFGEQPVADLRRPR
jgi:NAD(P)-dependent dehydrogenase (short-subunit alcohol dehydrogenase family)